MPIGRASSGLGPYPTFPTTPYPHSSGAYSEQACAWLVRVPSAALSRETIVWMGWWGKVVGAGRFELPTPGPPDRCANRAALRSDIPVLGDLHIPVRASETS